MTTTTSTPLPLPTPLSAPFWDGCRRGELLVQKCRDCGGLTFIPQVACMHCLSPELEWVRSSGRGSVYSYTVVWRPQMPAFEVPYVVALVELDEQPGLVLLANIVQVAPDRVEIGMRVDVTFENRGDHVVPQFRPSESVATSP